MIRNQEAPMSLTRRSFQAALCGLPFAGLLRADEFEAFRAMPWNGRARVARVYLAGAPHWPKPTLDIEAERREVETHLAEAARKNAHLVELGGGELLRSADEAKAWLARQQDIDGILLVPLTQPTPGFNELIQASPVPVLVFSRPYATHAWSSVAALREAGRRVEVVASSSYGDLDPWFRIFRTVHHLRHSKVLVGTENPQGRARAAEEYRSAFGTAFQFVSGADLKAAFAAADRNEARRLADEFVRNALRVVEPKPEEIENGLRMHLALKSIMLRERANAFTIDCFGTLMANTLPGYPCICWSRLNDAGLYGVCEADLHSTLTQMLVTSYAGVPGFVSDPVFDLSRNEVIHAHCVSATKLKGPDGPASPYIIRDHLETHEGAVLQVLMPCDETITVARFAGPKKMLVSTAVVTGYGDSDRGCRSQIRTRVPGAEKWLRNYQAGLHRVIFYGDHTRTLDRMSRLLGFELVQEV
ncbi:MAG: hypothetical protein N2036_14650 [Bryobacteraceae bacterium]|nr:hypothetical protein [Bryobacteraceae bacterium]